MLLYKGRRGVPISSVKTCSEVFLQPFNERATKIALLLTANFFTKNIHHRYLVRSYIHLRTLEIQSDFLHDVTQDLFFF